ncbi:MAG: DNA alkylation repair protein [Actinobacteria bacterium]|nr:DNA alkylation repair protein [Actinomycetota bacterium]
MSRITNQLNRSKLSVSQLASAFDAIGDAEKAAEKAAYMKNRFEFFGIVAKDRRAAASAMASVARVATAGDIFAFARACWDLPQREFHYTGADLLGWNVAKLEPSHLEDLKYLIATNSWWDTVDALASWSVGGLVANHPDLASKMDDWVLSDNMWIARTAILHQLRYKADTDAERLFRYVEMRAPDTEFFIRKALGWALREYAKTDPGAVRAFVAAHEAALSGLTKREALKNVGGP